MVVIQESKLQPLIWCMELLPVVKSNDIIVKSRISLKQEAISYMVGAELPDL